MSKKPSVTKTTHILPFERLSPLDFERLCLWLVRREGFANVEHLGAAGSEQGRDIVARKEGRRWAFQCKRVQGFSVLNGGREIDKIRSLPTEEQPDEYVFAVTRSVRADTRKAIREKWGDDDTCHFWVGTELDERVKRYVDILHEFFDLGPDGLRVLDSAVTPAEPPRYHSTYISYSRTDADRVFAFKLYDRLKAEGVSCWLYDHDMNPGEVELDTADRAIREAEKLLLCCSETSLTSWWVNDELGKAIEKERALWSEGRGLVLIPLKLDDYLLRWESGKASQVRERYPADFVGWQEDPGKFDEQLQRVLRALKVEGAREAPPAPRL